MSHVKAGIVGGSALALVLWLVGCGDDSSSKHEAQDDASTSSAAGCPAGESECVGQRGVLACPADASGWVSFACAAGESCDDGTCVAGEGAEPTCTAGAMQCSGDRVALVCAPEGVAWLPVACGASEKCTAGECVASIDAGTPAPAPDCGDPGDTECLTDRIERVCDGERWALAGCNAGERCSDDACAAEPPADPICDAGDRECASDELARVCSAEGTWLSVQCGSGQRCAQGACQPTCTPGEGFCLGDDTGLRCLATGLGYEALTCPDGTDCRAGSCVGPVCTVGASRCTWGARPGVEVCEDGSAWVTHTCADGVGCVESVGPLASAQCTEGDCQQGESRCGDPTDSSVDPTRFFSRCDLLTDGSVGWARGECTAPDTCDPVLAGYWYQNPCNHECTAGSQRCGADGLSVETCGSDSTWGAPQACNTGTALARVCRVAPPSAGGTSVARCVDPVCAALWDAGETEGGVCTSNDDLRACSDSGVLSATATACTTGGCRALGAANACGPGEFACGEGFGCISEFSVCNGYFDCPNGADELACGPVGGFGGMGGFGGVGGFGGGDGNDPLDTAGLEPGQCIEECQAGEEQCLPGSSAWRACDGGVWSSTFSMCSTGTCHDYVDAQGLRQTSCECAAGERRCEPGVDDPGIQTCGNDERWGTVTACPVGRCVDLGTEVACVAECVPGSQLCVGGGKLASDERSVGTDAVAVCGSDGRIPDDVTPCEDTTTCRHTANGQVLGCVECVGAASGNELGVVDSRCSDDGVQLCQSSNDWGTATACADGTECRVSEQVASCIDPLACIVSDLGSAVGAEVARGNNAAGQDALSSYCNFSPSRELAYAWTAPSDGWFVFDTFGSSFDTVLGIVAGDCNGFVLGCNDDWGGGASQVQLQLAAGQRVVVFVEGYGGQTGEFVLDIGVQPSPCDLSEFFCPSGGWCVPGFSVCDGYPDCPFGEDEEACPPPNPDEDGGVGMGGGCGDGMIGFGEECDPAAPLPPISCADLGYGDGVLGCDPFSCLFDVSMCN